jgi:glycosyltransferase involved in cell wall biosynthesis
VITNSADVGGAPKGAPSLFWVNMLNDQQGNGYGYSMHAKMLREACIRAGSEDTHKAGMAVHIITPDKFHPIPGKRNALFTMYECTTLPNDWIAPIQEADVIVVPCKQNRDLFRQYTKRPVEVCWEGVDTEAFPYVERKMPLVSRFVFLWVGAPNPRKGFEHVGAAWDGLRASGRLPPNAWLYCKSTGVERADVVEEKPGMRVTIDTRNLSTADLFGLYRDAHAFMLPSMGEGFGLTLAEAMSTGLPCIYTPWGGPRDFIDETCGYPVKWDFTKVVTMKTQPDGTRKKHQQTYAAFADVDDIMRKMEQIYFGYDAALAKGRRAAERIRKGFTWDISARSFLDIVRRHEGREMAA